MKRSGVTLIEFLVVIAIIGVLFGLVANAVLFARRASLDMQCKNNLRQMMLAHVSYFSQSPDYFPDGDKDIKAFAPHYKILENMGTPVQFGPKMFYPNSPFFRCPNDPTLANLEYIGEALPEITSYPFNALVYVSNVKIPGSIFDGVSNTFGISEKYAVLQSSISFWTVGSGVIGRPVRPSTFADSRYDDNRPVHDTATGRCTGSTTGETFLIRPDPSSDPLKEMISGHSGGINLGFLDGSVRYLSKEISPNVFWAQATPASAD